MKGFGEKKGHLFLTWRRQWSRVQGIGREGKSEEEKEHTSFQSLILLAFRD